MERPQIYALVLAAYALVAHAATSAPLQNAAPSFWPAGVTGVTFGTGQRYKDASGKEMCAIVKPLSGAPEFERGVTEITYAVGLKPRSVTKATASVTAPAGQELRTEPCNIFTLVEAGFSQTQLGSTLSRADKAPLTSGRYVLRVTVDGQTQEVPFTIK